MTASFNRSDLSSQALKAWQNAHPELAPDHGQPLPPPKLCHDYDPKEPPPMTAPSTLTPAEQFRADMMSLLDQMRSEIEQMHAEITQIRDGLTHAASAPAPAPIGGETITLLADRITRTSADGKKYYRMRGGMYAKYGISVWPEVLAQIGLGAIVFDDHDAYTIKPPIHVRALVEEYTAKDGTHKRGPQKVIGLA